MKVWLALALGCAFGGYAAAQEAAAESTPLPAAIAAPALSPSVVPSGTILNIAIAQPISSKTAKIGDRFPIQLADPLIVSGVTVLPAGTPGEGQVVHAARARLGGKAGELLLAARFLKLGDQQINLRGFELSAVGQNRTSAAVNLGAAASLAGPAGGIAFYIIPGGEIEIPAGSAATAKLSNDLEYSAETQGALPLSQPSEPTP